MLRNGFTLLELSIVLVIIGLIIGGITVGSEMIKQAELRALSNEMQEMQTALRTFQLKYNQLPGDFNQASNYWPACDTPATDCNGNNNKTVASSPVTNSEAQRLWQHLSLAGLAGGSFQGKMTTDATLQIGKHVPAGPITGVGYLTRTMWAYDRLSLWLEVGTPGGGANAGYMNGALLSVTDTKSLDDKIDDGLAISGKLRGVGGTSNNCTGVAYNDTSGTGSYQLSNSAATCVVNFEMQ